MKMKRLISLCLGTALCVGSISLIGCGEAKTADAATVMNIDLNPSVEFVLDANDKVISVNANNNDGNLIISAEAFRNVEGKTAEQAVELFVEVSRENGFLVKGSANAKDNEINISISGDTKKAEEIFNKAKAEADKYFSKENITANLKKAEAVTKAELEKLVEQVAPYIEKAKIEAMNEAELIKELAESRKETAEFYSQELKDAYYEAKAYAMEQAKFDVIKSNLSEIEKASYNAYLNALKSIETIRNEQLISAESGYQKALSNLREKKAEYLNFKKANEGNDIPEEVQTILDAKLKAYETAETALVNAGKLANSALDGAKKLVETGYKAVNKIMEKVNDDKVIEEISTKCTEAQTTFFTNFENTYKTAKESSLKAWQDMSKAIKVKAN